MSSASSNSRSMSLSSESISVQLTHQEIDYTALTESVRSHGAGAVVLFMGTVREFTGGRQTAALEYDAYPDMARAKMDEICRAAADHWPLAGIGLIHRLGRLELGEISVAVAVSSPHRQDAFEAGRYIIDRLKETVPVWKQENWADGTTEWVHPGTEQAT